MANPSKGADVAAQPRKKVDTSKYSGRVAARLRELREKRDMSREQLWSALAALGQKASVPSIYAWENGSRKIDPDLYPVLAKALGCKSVAEFLPSK